MIASVSLQRLKVYKPRQMAYLTTIEREKTPDNSGSASVPLLSGTQLIGDGLLGVTSEAVEEQLERRAYRVNRISGLRPQNQAHEQSIRRERRHE